ncbi:MAG TPA: uroporphyrinogen-III C-methyltransferase [Solirubrobacteraceae bacterium]|nr:uroporphyrinogen-III C-methyltransferase [Solirubrobacteraceae bacterium]
MSAEQTAPGRVHLVGAGPGDPSLMTERALHLIATAEVILHDRLIPAGALDGARPDAELVFVGKEGGGESVPQERTEQLMIERARAGRTVVRLKGGDPFVFGRGGEEALALTQAGIPFEIVPGITAGIAASAYAGIPVTHRGLASAVALVTGHEDPDKEETAVDWQALAAFPGTLVFYMGVRALPAIAASLIAGGRSPGEPAAVVEAGTLPSQRTITATLETIAEAALREAVRPPSITVVGAVAGLAEELSWRAPLPLAGLTVAVTRARAQASGLAARLRELGARVVEAPVIRTEPLPGPAPDLSGYDLLCLTSANGVAALFGRLAAAGLDARSLAGLRVAAIGPGTAAALAEHGILADVVPDGFVAEGLVEALASLPVKRALIARAAEGRDVLPDALRARGAEVDVLALYETIAEPPAPRALQAALAGDYITFTSSSAVRHFLQAADATLPPGLRVVSIGPITSRTLRDAGIEPHVEADSHDVDGVLAALVADAGARAGR